MPRLGRSFPNRRDHQRFIKPVPLDAYPAAVRADTPVAYWRLGEGSGNPQDSVGTNHVTVVGGGPTYAQAGALSGDSNTAIALHGAGSNDHFTAPDVAALDVADVFTYEIWVKRAVINSLQVLFDKGAGSAAVAFETTGAGHENKIALFKDSSGLIAYSTVTVTDLTTWHHIVITKNGAAVAIYLDGVDVTGTVTNQTLTDTGTAQQIGRDSAGSLNVNGSIDEAAIYNYALSPARVLAHFQAGVGGAYQAAVRGDRPSVYYRLGEPTGTFKDTLGGDDATATGSPTRDVGHGGFLGDDGGVAFPTLSDFITVPHSSRVSVGDGPMTLEVWASRSTDTATWEMMFHKDINGYAVGVNATDKLFIGKAGIGALFESSSSVPTDGSWHHYVITRSAAGAGNTKVYVDAVDVTVAVDTATVMNDTASVLRIGSWNGASERWTGGLDELAIYPRVLTNAQIAAHYEAAGGVVTGAYPVAVRADNPVAYWRLGEASGNPQDSVGTNHVTTVGGSPVYGAAGALTGALSGSANTAITLDGTSEYFVVPDHSSLDVGGTAVSYECWFKRTGNFGVNYSYLMSKGNQGQLGFDIADRLIWEQDGSLSCESTLLFTATENTGWHHVVATHDGNLGVNKLYVDGVDVTQSHNNNGFSSTTLDLQIGRYHAGGNYFGGSIDEVAYYGVVLTPAQVLAHFRAGVGGAYAAAVRGDRPSAYWRFGETSGTNANDEIGTNDGTYTGTFALSQTGALIGDPNTAADGYILAPDATDMDLGDGPFTIEGWFKRAGSIGAAGCLYSKNSGVQLGNPVLYLETDNTITVYKAGSGTIGKSTATVTDTTTWHHLVYTKSGAANVIYLDGVDVTGTITNFTTTNNTAQVAIGADSEGTANLFDGAVDEWAIYKSVLTPARVLAHFQAGVGGVYAAAVRGDRPAAYWRLGEASGSPQDSIGTNHVTTVGGTPTYGVAGALLGDADKGVTFDASGDYFSVPDATPLDLGDGPFSIEFWLKRTTDTGAYETVLSKGTNGYSVAVGGPSGGAPIDDKLVLIKDNVSVLSQSTTSVPADSSWHHYVITRTATRGAGSTIVYVDATAGTADNDTVTTVADTAEALQIGRDAVGSDGPFLGGMDELAIYKSVLTPAQVLAHYQAAGYSVVSAGSAQYIGGGYYGQAA